MSDTFLRQKTTSMPIIAYGRTLPRYTIYGGVGLSPRKIINGRNLSPMVTRAHTATISTE